MELGVPPAPLNVTNALAEPTFTARAVATPVPSPVMPPTATFVAVDAVVAVVAVAAFPPIDNPLAVPVRLVAVMELGVPPAPLNKTGAPADPTFTARAVATLAPSPVIPPTATAEAVAALPVQLAELPDVFWLSVGKSPATAIDGTPVVVVFLSIPVARTAKDVPFILTTVAAFPTDVTSPVKLALVVTVVASVALAALPPIDSPLAVPVRFVATPLEGVPNAPPLTTGAPAEPTFTARAVATPVPRPVIPPTATADAVPAVKPAAVPVRFVATPADGVPISGVTRIALVDITTLPVPVIALLTRPLLPSEKTACDAVREDRIGCAVKVATPVTLTVDCNVTAPAMFANPPTHRAFCIDAPPAFLLMPVVIEVASVVPASVRTPLYAEPFPNSV